GGMVPLKTLEIREVLGAVNEVRRPGTTFHLLGVTRTESMPEFADRGVSSFDSTSPLRRAFKDEKHNYYTFDGAYAAIRIPQIEGNPKLERAIRAGRISQPEARALEQACLKTMARLDRGDASVDETLDVLTRFDQLFEIAEGKTKGARQDVHLTAYRQV